jgi:hypothetical protein
MRLKTIFIFITLAVSCNLSAQNNTDVWLKWKYLIGNWAGEGNGTPGKGTGFFSFKTDLNDKILVRKNYSEYPATADKPAIVHNDILIIYPDTSGNPVKAIYFDNEGHVINYAISYSDSSIVLTSNISNDSPRFRLTYKEIDNKTVHIKFEIAFAQKPDEFKPYVEGNGLKTN